MRPVNLIPPEERRGESAPLRHGSLSYLIVGGLAAVLVGAVLTVMTQNTIAERETEIATLESREAEARARAESLAPFAEFTNVADARSATVSSLAQSRFDWYRVLRELSLVIPEDVSLSSLDGTVSGADAAGGEGSDLAAGSLGPSLSMSGCAAGHEAVAGFLEDLKDIDGVTRVGAENSTLGEGGGSSAGAASSADVAKGCGSGQAEFSVVAVFDGVVTAAAGTTPPAPAPVTPAGGDATAISDPAVADGQAQEQEARESIGEQSEKSRNAANLIPGVAR